MPEQIVMRVIPGKAPLPYNDGEGSKLHQPGDVFEGAPRLLTELSGWVEAVDAEGRAFAEAAEHDPRLLTARPHEQVTYLSEMRAAREQAHASELADLDRQIAAATAAADVDARERASRRAESGQEQPQSAAPARARKAATPEVAHG